MEHVYRLQTRIPVYALLAIMEPTAQRVGKIAREICLILSITAIYFSSSVS